MIHGNRQEIIRQQIISDTKAEMLSISRFFSRLSVIPTTVDFCMDSKEILPEEMVFEKGLTPKLTKTIFIVGLLVLMACAIFSDQNLLSNAGLIFMMIAFVIIFCVLFYFFIGPTAKEKIAISNKGITLNNTKTATWDTIEYTYIKEIIGNKRERFFFIISNKNGTYIQHEFSNEFGSKYKNIGHYTELYKRNYTVVKDL